MLRLPPCCVMGLQMMQPARVCHAGASVAQWQPSLLDASGAPTLCIELKPKWGCLPSAATIHPNDRLKRQKSKFQLQQMLKLAEASSAVSSQCLQSAAIEA